MKTLNELSATGMKFHGHNCSGRLEENFSDISLITRVEVLQGQGVFAAKPCARCGELTFVNKLQETAEGLVCIPCMNG
jgi:formylmethanofuran dehydrogenase subunit E